MYITTRFDAEHDGFETELKVYETSAVNIRTCSSRSFARSLAISLCSCVCMCVRVLMRECIGVKKQPNTGHIQGMHIVRIYAVLQSDNGTQFIQPLSTHTHTYEMFVVVVLGYMSRE